MRPFLHLLTLLLAPAVLAQPRPSDVLPDSVRARLQLELREMARTDQHVRYMALYGTLSPCAADSLGRALESLPFEEYIARDRVLRAEADARLSPVEKTFLLRAMRDADRSILARLRAIIATYGWPSDERTGADVHPLVFLLHAPEHAPDLIEEMRPELLAEVRAGRLPPRVLAVAVDKSRKVRGELQLYGTADEFDRETQTVGPPQIASIDATNAARREIGLPPLEAYRIAGAE